MLTFLQQVVAMTRLLALLGVSLALLDLASGVAYSQPKKCSTNVGITTGIYSRQKVPNHQTCQKLCDDDSNCKSFNYVRAKKQKCVLNSDVAGSEPQKMTYKPSNSYTEKLGGNTFKTSSCLDFKECRPIDTIDTHVTVVNRRDTYGWWGRDCWPGATDDYWYEMTSNYYRNHLYVYSSESNFKMDFYEDITLPFYCDGPNNVVYKRVLYCDAYGTYKVYTYDLDTSTQSTTIDFTSVEGKVAGYSSQCRYEAPSYSDIDIASDEFGLWVIWGRYDEDCTYAISKIDHVTKTIVKTWFPPRGIGFKKNDFGNAFMVCGNMYVANDYYDLDTYVRWIYYTGNSTWVEISGSDPNRIILENNNRYNGYINYSPRDNKLYTWENAYHNTYLVHFRNP